MSRFMRLITVLAVTVLVAAACGDDDDDTTADTAQEPTTTEAEEPTTEGDGGDADDAAAGENVVEVAEAGDFGEVLVDGAGFSLYAFTNDEPGVSNCSGGCADTWPPLIVEGGDVSVGAGIDGSAVGTITRDDGSTQVTINDQPLYTYAPDAAPGDTNGQGVGGIWFLLSPDGSLIRS